MALWDEARELLVQRLREHEDRASIEDFLRSRATVEDAQQSAVSLREDSNRKYGLGDSHSKGLSAKWMKRIMDNLGQFIKFGDVAMTAAPESASLVWFAVKQVLNAVQNNYKLYATFNTALNDITETMVLVRTYENLYESYASKDDGSIYYEVCKALRELYVSILDFSYAVRKHITAAEVRSKLANAFKGTVGALNQAFESKINKIHAQKALIIERSQAAFAQKTSDQLGTVSGELNAIQLSVKEVLDFHQQSTSEWKGILEDLKASKAPSHRELALTEYEKNRKQLHPRLEGSDSILHKRICERDEGTSEWIATIPSYVSWRDASSSSLLILAGEANSGKSVVGAHVHTSLSNRSDVDQDCIVQYVSYDSYAEDERNALATIENAILHDIYQHALDGAHDDLLLQKCNGVFVSQKQDKGSKDATHNQDAAHTRRSAEDNSLDLVDILPKLISELGKPIYLIIDLADVMSDADQDKFAEHLVKLSKLSHIGLHILLVCRSSSFIYVGLSGKDIDQIITSHHNEDDVKLIIANAAKMIPDLSPAERAEVESAVSEKTGHRIQYIKKVAIPFLQTPLRRPVSRWLKYLPENINETYLQHLKQLSPNYRDLLDFVLSWVLVADTPLTVEEVMEAYTCIYFDVSSVENLEKSDSNFKFYRKQIQQAGGPFLEIRDGGLITLQDEQAVRGFCLSSSETAKEEIGNDGVCSKCGSVNQNRAGMLISERRAHLEAAITCMKHLNSDAFQSRFSSKSLQEARERAEKRLSSDSINGDDLKTHQDDINKDKKVNGDTNQEGDPEKGPEADADSAKSTETSAKDVQSTEEISKVTDETAADEDESVFSDQDEDYDPAPDDLEFEANESKRGRYEYFGWSFHIREAERLWAVEERQADSKWHELLEELERFFIKAPVAFEAWKLAFVMPAAREAWDPIFFAVKEGLTSLAELLFDRGAKVTDLSPEGFALLHVANENYDPLEMIRMLLKKGADPNFEGEKWMSPFHDLLFFDPKIETVDEFLRYGASCTMMSKRGEWNAAHCIALRGTRPEVLKHLIENPHDEANRMDINCRDESKETPLHKLLSRTEVPIDMLKDMLQYGADVNKDDCSSQQPLQNAAFWGEIETIKAIIDQVKDINDDNNLGRTALHSAAWRGEAEVVDLLLKHGADPNRRDHHNRTPLLFACLTHWRTFSAKDGHEKVAKLLIDEQIKRGATFEEINPFTKQGRSPLREASGRGFLDIVECILSRMEPEDRACINKQDSRRGHSPLHSASTHGRTQVVMALLEKGADPQLRDGNDGVGKTSFELCLDRWAIIGSKRYEDTIMVLIDACNEEAKASKLLLTSAAVHGSIRVLEKLTELGVDLQAPDPYGWQPEQLSSQFGHTETAAFIKKHLAKQANRPQKWVLERSDTTTKVSEEGSHVSHEGGPKRVLVADHPVPASSSTYYFEIEVMNPETDEVTSGKQDGAAIVALGFCTSAADAYVFPGWPPKGNSSKARSWAYHADDGGFFHGQGSAKFHGPCYGPGDTVGCCLDLEAHKIFFTRNGVEIEEHSFSGVKGRLFPMLGLEDKVKLRTNFGIHEEGQPFRSTRMTDETTDEPPPEN